MQEETAQTVTQVAPELGSRAEKKAFYKHTISITAPIALQNFMDAAVSSADVIMLSFVSQAALAASSLAVQVMFVMQMLMFGISSGASVLAAQYWGKGDRRAVEKVMGLSLRITILIGAAFSLAALCVPQLIMRIFTDDAVLIGVGVAVLLWCSKTLSDILEPYLVMLNSLPKSALAPVLIVWLGNNVRTIIVAAVSVAVFGCIMTLYTGFREIDEDKLKLIRTLGGGKKQIITKVLIPGSVPLIVSSMKVNIGLCLVGVIIGEFLAAQYGLGYLIIYGSQVFKLDLVMMSIVILCMISAGLYLGVNVLEKKFGKERE
jgi:NitT/TauT family transport system permease protein